MPHPEVPQRPCPRILHLASQLQALALGPAAIQFILTFMFVFIFIFIKFRPFVEALPQPSSCTVLLVRISEHMSQLDHSARARLDPHDGFMFSAITMTNAVVNAEAPSLSPKNLRSVPCKQRIAIAIL